MSPLAKWLAIAVVGVGLAGAANVAQAGCGKCGGDAGHAKEGEEKAACVKCEHAKVCTATECADAAHTAACTCPAKEEAKTEAAM